MIDRSLIRRYVAAVYRLAQEAGQVERVQAELTSAQAALRADRRVSQILTHPGISVEDKQSLLLRLGGEDPSAIYRGLVDVLLKKERTAALDGAAEVFGELADEAAGVVRAWVEVAVAPDEEQSRRLAEALGKLVGAPVVLELAVNPDVIGGARVEVSGRLIDGTLTGRMARLMADVESAPA